MRAREHECVTGERETAVAWVEGTVRGEPGHACDS
jgi:hypothetical protein